MDDGRGTPEEFCKMKLSAMLMRLVYPTVLSEFAGQMDIDQVRDRVFRIGVNSGSQFYEYKKFKGKKLTVIVKKIFKKVWDSKVKIIKEGKGDTFFLESKKCPVCGELPPLDLPELHYCIPVAGFLQGYLNKFVNDNDVGVKSGTIKCTTIQSRCTHESKTCIHKMVIEGGNV